MLSFPFFLFFFHFSSVNYTREAVEHEMWPWLSSRDLLTSFSFYSFLPPSPSRALLALAETISSEVDAVFAVAMREFSGQGGGGRALWGGCSLGGGLWGGLGC